MSLTTGLTKPKRMAVGILMLLVMDVIWVASSEITKYLYNDVGYNKPFFTTYLKTSMFMLYLLGFLFWRPWRRQCLDCFDKPKSLVIDEDSLENEEHIGGQDHLLSDPLYVPVKFNDSDKDSSRSSSLSELNDSTSLNGRVRFSNLMEVRHLSDTVAEEAMIARLSYNATQRAKETIQQTNKFTIPQVAKISFMFCLVWFLGNFAYQEALDDTQVAVVNTLSSTSGLFTVLLAALFPSSQGDKFTLTKLVAVCLSVGGIFMVSYYGGTSKDDRIKLGSLWALGGAFFYAVYLVALKRKVDNEDKIDIPMFFGFVGLFNFVMVWPGIVILHYTSVEPFQLPSTRAWVYLAVNGIVGTVISEFLWLWGCFLTSSLIATLALSLTIPMSVLVDIYFNEVDFSLMFLIGCIPVFVSFIVVALLTHYNEWDPAWALLKRLYFCFHRLGCLFCRIFTICRRKTPHVRLPSSDDKDQSESLIALHNMDGNGNSLDCC